MSASQYEHSICHRLCQHHHTPIAAYASTTQPHSSTTSVTTARTSSSIRSVSTALPDTNEYRAQHHAERHGRVLPPTPPNPHRSHSLPCRSPGPPPDHSPAIPPVQSQARHCQTGNVFSPRSDFVLLRWALLPADPRQLADGLGMPGVAEKSTSHFSAGIALP